MMRAKVYKAKYEALARWFLEHQTKLDYQDSDIEDLGAEIDLAIDEWFTMACRLEKENA